MKHKIKDSQPYIAKQAELQSLVEQESDLRRAGKPFSKELYAKIEQLYRDLGIGEEGGISPEEVE